MKKWIIVFTFCLLIVNSMVQPTNAIAPSEPVIYPTEIFKPIEVPATVIIEPDKDLLIIPTSRPKIKESLLNNQASSLTTESKTLYTWDNRVSWYGPSFYGHRTACGYKLTTKLLGVAHRSLPCGTKVEFTYKGRHKIVSVVDRGPYVSGRQWDLTGGLCVYLRHCFTGPIEYRIVK